MRYLAHPPKKSLLSPDGIKGAALSSDGSLLAVATYSSAEESENQDKITLWDLAAGRTLGSVTLPGSFYSREGALAFSPDGQWLATADMFYGEGEKAGKIRLWRTSEIK